MLVGQTKMALSHVRSRKDDQLTKQALQQEHQDVALALVAESESMLVLDTEANKNTMDT